MNPSLAIAGATSSGTLIAIKVIGGLIALLVLAYLGGHRRVVQFQERLGISGVITAGFPFVLMGALAEHADTVDILTDDVIGRSCGRSCTSASAGSASSSARSSTSACSTACRRAPRT